MKENNVISTRIEDISDWDWLSYPINDGEDIQFVTDDEETIADAAKLWGMTPAAVKAIKEAFDYFAETIVDLLSEDLKDIWKKR